MAIAPSTRDRVRPQVPRAPLHPQGDPTRRRASPQGSPRPRARGRTPPTCRSALAGWAYHAHARWPRITTAAGTAAAVAYVRSDRASTGGYRSRQMRVRLIVNPTATGVRGPVLDAVVAQLERVCELDVVETERAGHAVELAREVDSGAVVGVGGDGTANEVANGVRPGVLMGVLPAGASSVFARHLGFPRDTVAAGGMMADAIRQESTKSVGLGVADERRFTFAAGPRARRRGDRGRRPHPGGALVPRPARRPEGGAGGARHPARGGVRPARADDDPDGPRQLPPRLLRRGGQPAPVHVLRPGAGEGGAAGRLRARPRRRLHPRAPPPRPVAPPGLRPPLAAARPPRVAAGRLSPRPGRLLGGVRRADRHPDRRRVPGPGRARPLPLRARRDPGASCRPATTADAAV